MAKLISQRRGWRAYFVLGMHRSGTSAVSAVLAAMGAAPPRTMMRPQPDNPEGFWESSRIADYNETLLKRSGLAGWADPSPLGMAAGGIPQPAHVIAEMVALLGAEFASERDFVLKDPRCCRLAPSWLRAIEAFGAIPTPILVIRNPLDVAASLGARNGLGRAAGLLLWLVHVLAAERGTRGLPRGFIHYETMMRWPERAFQGALASAGATLSWPSSGLGAVLRAGLQHHRAATAEIFDSPFVPGLVRRVYAEFLLGKHQALNLDALDDATRVLAQACDLAILGGIESVGMPGRGNNLPALGASAGAVVGGNGPEATKGANPPGSRYGGTIWHAGAKMTRFVVVHYHLFKNAGTSVDRALREAFGDGWLEVEGEGGGALKSEDLAKWLIERPSARAVSSHTAHFPVPEIPETAIFPIIFVRHPIDRVRSVYAFERKQNAQTRGAQQAKALSLRDYVAWRIGPDGDWAISDFQSRRLARAVPGTGSDSDRAIAALGALPFVGVVERFAESMARFEALISQANGRVSFNLHRANVTQDQDTSIEERCEALRAELGDALFQQLMDCNRGDMALHAAAVSALDALG